ncbi:MAG: hypothetical protein KF819_32725 [Labilithrix sp.]|nr:hypothetical protein [Labilithrix sp.]
MAHRRRVPWPWAIVFGVAACTSSSSSSDGDGDAGEGDRPRGDGPRDGSYTSLGESDAGADRTVAPADTCAGGKPSYDLDGDRIVDADQNRLTNGNFHTSTKGWTASSPSTSTVTWSGAHESLCAGTSGTLELVNQSTDGSDVDVRQCVKFPGNAEYGIAARGFVAEDQPAGTTGALAVAWFSDERCTALIRASRDIVLAPSPGTWASGGRVEKSPADARSALVTLSVKGDTTAERRVEFDDVLLR